MSDDIHLHAWAPEHERQHEESPFCWCGPEAIKPCREKLSGLLIIRHWGLPRPSVTRSIAAGIRLFPGQLGHGVINGTRS